MIRSKEKFQELRKQADNGMLELKLSEFADSFMLAKDFFNELELDLSQIQILSEVENSFRIKAFSKDFLFKKTIFKNESVNVEAEFQLINDQLEMFAICKLHKTPNKLSMLPGVLGDLFKPLDFIEIDELVYILSTKETSEIKSVEFPVFHEKKISLKPGVNLAGFIDLKNSGKVISLVTKPLKPIIGEGPYFMSWNIKDKLNIDFSLELPKDIDIEGVFKVKQPKIVLKPILPVQISIDGLFDIALPAIPEIKVLGGFTFTADGIRGKFHLDKILDKIPAPLGYPGVHLSTLTVTAGLSNGIPVVGAEGNFYIGPGAPNDLSSKPAVQEFGGIKSNQYKFIYDVIPGKVIPKFAFLYLDKLMLQEYIMALTNKNVSLPSFLSKISMEQIMLHWCETPQGEVKPDGTAAFPIFGLSAIINIFGHHTFAEFLADAMGESKGKLIADPIDIGNGLLVIEGNGKGTPTKYKGSTKVESGGIELMFSSDGQPNFFAFSAKVQVLGLSGEAEGTLTDNGITASIQSNIAGIIHERLEVVFADSNFKVDTAIAAKISGLKISLGKLGSVNLNTSLEGYFSAIFANDNFSSSMHLNFEFAGITFDLGDLNVSIKDLKNIVKELEEFIREAVIEKLKDVLVWLTAVIADAIEFVGDKLEQVGQALNEAFNQSLESAAKLMRQVGYQAKEVGEALKKGYKVAEQELIDALKKAGALAEEAGEVLKDVANIAGEAAAEVLKKAGYAMEEIGRTLKNVYGLGDEKVGQILKSIGGTAEDVAKVLRDVFKLGAEQVGNVMKGLGFAAETVASALKIIGEPVENIHKVLINVYKQPDEAALKVLEVVGFPIKVITDILPHVKVPLPHIKLPVHVKVPHIKVF